MLNADNKKLKGNRVEKKKSNGDNTEVLALLNAIATKQQEQDERLEELEGATGREAAHLKLVNLLYDTDETHLPGLTRLPLRAIKPFALAMMLDAITHDDVRTGKVSLQQVFRTSYFTLMRSVGAEAFNKGIGLAGEQAAAEQERGTGLDMGAE